MCDIKILEQDLRTAFNAKNINLDDYLEANTIAKKINYYMETIEDKPIKQSVLARRSGLSKSFICQLVNFKKDAFVRHDLDTIERLSDALRLNQEQYDELVRLSYPHLIITREAKKLGYSIDDIDAFLFENNLPTYNKEK